MRSVESLAALTRVLGPFVEESNRIEGINVTSANELLAHARFMVLDTINVEDLEQFVRTVAGRPLRDRPGMNVRVGPHVPVPGGPAIRTELGTLVHYVNAGDQYLTPYEAHRRYEHLHPFMDGNGRSGRILWAWHMEKCGRDPFSLAFLHRWYYESLNDR